MRHLARVVQPVPSMRSGIAVGLALFVVVATALPLLRVRVWWVRIWDFPRLQLAALAALALLLGAGTWGDGGAWHPALGALTALALAYQLAKVWRYTPFAPKEVQDTRGAGRDPGRTISLVVCNVLEKNRDADRLISVVRGADADLVLCVETDEWWRERLDALSETHPHAVRVPLPNTYGMLLYSRLPLSEVQVEHLVQDDIPSIQARVRLGSGEVVWLNCVHPRPPAPSESDDSLPRDAELLLVGKRVGEATGPVILCGDLNDVAWSSTTRLFQKISRLLDPRKGRGMFSTFHAHWPVIRWPLDHVFFSDDFRLVSLRRLPDVGSDHFPVYVCLHLEPGAAAQQEAPEADDAAHAKADETIAQARGSE
ncbi:MAG: endonuclease/exonuclease/phosphatase family protein [Archangium sp.]|nr:endonuclease/exonuclease/phosphatase family protein [Archangium sp.]